jgi:hypothetical protein
MGSVRRAIAKASGSRDALVGDPAGCSEASETHARLAQRETYRRKDVRWTSISSKALLALVSVLRHETVMRPRSE